jgi:UDP-glucuronate 4-epimerase
VTGGAGFIGSHLVERLLNDGWAVTAIDNFDPFYEPKNKWANLKQSLRSPEFRLVEADMRDLQVPLPKFKRGFDVIVHLAAKVGVRPSIDDPHGYYDVNVHGTQQMLELCRNLGVPHFVFASSSSVYGVSPDVPWREEASVLRPISPYASTKVSGELLGHVYSHLYGIRFIALRFFTVYGPRQRPDLAIHKFVNRAARGLPLPVYGDGTSLRDYTYVHDIVQGIRAAMEYRQSPYEVINLGCGNPITLTDLINTISEASSVPVRLEALPNQPGDVPRTYASIEKAERLLGYRPQVSFQEGIHHFITWFQKQANLRVNAETF